MQSRRIGTQPLCCRVTMHVAIKYDCLPPDMVEAAIKETTVLVSPQPLSACRPFPPAATAAAPRPRYQPGLPCRPPHEIYRIRHCNNCRPHRTVHRDKNSGNGAPFSLCPAPGCSHAMNGLISPCPHPFISPLFPTPFSLARLESPPPAANGYSHGRGHPAGRPNMSVFISEPTST